MCVCVYVRAFSIHVLLFVFVCFYLFILLLFSLHNSIVKRQLMGLCDIGSIPHSGSNELFLKWCNKFHGMYCPNCWTVHIKTIQLRRGSGFPFSLSKSPFNIRPTSFIHVLSASLNKTFPFLSINQLKYLLSLLSSFVFSSFLVFFIPYFLFVFLFPFLC